MDFSGCFLKGRDGAPMFLNHRIPAVGYDGAIRRCKPPSLGEAHGRISTQTKVPAVAVNHHPLYPGLRPGRGDVQIKPGTITASAGFG